MLNKEQIREFCGQCDKLSPDNFLFCDDEYVEVKDQDRFISKDGLCELAIVEKIPGIMTVVGFFPNSEQPQPSP